MQEKVLMKLQREESAQLERLGRFLSIPSVSTLPSHKNHVIQAAQWIRGELLGMGMEAEIHETAGHPVVVGKWHHRPGRPTVLVYAHYDVQPAEPLGLWTTPPFEPAVRDGKLFARGSSDDKGPLFMHMLVAEAFLQETDGLPANLTFLFEGEEEVGSEHLPPFVLAHREELKADCVLISDTTLFSKETPSLVSGLRGLAGIDIIVKGPRQDIHSGLFGGAVANPIHALATMIASLHDPDGRVSVPGFYDQVEPPSAEEKASWEKLPFTGQGFLDTTGSPALFGEKGFSTLDRIWARPTLEVNGITGGVQEGHKTIVPALARATMTCRLVPHQDPVDVQKKVVDHLRRVTPEGVTVEVSMEQTAPAALTRPDSKAAQLAAAAMEEGFGSPPAFTRMGGSIPIVPALEQALGAPVVLMGFGLDTDNFHGPNEHFDLENYRRGLKSLVAFWSRLETQGL